MSKYIFYSHINSGNRGCEAIVRSTIPLLKARKNDIVIISDDIEIDKKCGLSEVAKLVPTRSTKGINKLLYMTSYLLSKSKIVPSASINYRYGDVLSNSLEKGSIAISTGGDLYCYPDYQWLSYLSDIVKKKDANNVLWGCTIDANSFNENMRRALDKYDLITVRESKTFESLKVLNVRSKVIYVPDTAFTLKPKEWDISNYIGKGTTIGVNVSNFVFSNNSFMMAVKKFIKHLLENPNNTVLLIPHVYWKLQDDIATSQYIKKEFQNNGRVKVVSDLLNCQELKYLISKCDFFMGARTHSMIAAYSSCVPSITFGYSIKSIGIANDLGIHDDFVIDTNKEVDENLIINKFEGLCSYNMKEKLRVIILEMQKKVVESGQLLSGLQ